MQIQNRRVMTPHFLLLLAAKNRCDDDRGMIEKLCWIALGLIHLPPSIALFHPALLTRLYGVEQGSGSFLLLRHRAALFLVIVIICAWALLAPEIRRLACVSVGISMISFLILYVINGSPIELRSIAIADGIGLPLLAFVAWRSFAPRVRTH